MLSGAGVSALRGRRDGVLVSQEISQAFVVHPGDVLSLTLFPDDEEKSRNVNLRVLGVYRSVPPTDPPAELVISDAQLPPWLLPVPEFYLARTAPGQTPAAVATALRHEPVGRSFRVATIADHARLVPRSLTTLNLDGLSQIEAIGAGLVAAIGVAVLGAFLVLERRREFAILRTLGADTPRVLVGPALEGGITVAGSILVGVPLGLALGILSVRVLGLFFDLPPPLLALPAGGLAAFVLVVVLASAVALVGALVAVDRASTAGALRET
jgi:putative ABC transport system permease protein